MHFFDVEAGGHPPFTPRQISLRMFVELFAQQSFYPRRILYLDSTRSEGKEYSRLRKVLDDALNGYNVKLGNNAVSKKNDKR
jgi:hypothetical protein